MKFAFRCDINDNNMKKEKIIIITGYVGYHNFPANCRNMLYFGVVADFSNEHKVTVFQII